MRQLNTLARIASPGRLLIGLLIALGVAAIAALVANGYAIYQVKGADGLFPYVFVLLIVTAVSLPRLLDAFAGNRRAMPLRIPPPAPRPCSVRCSSERDC